VCAVQSEAELMTARKSVRSGRPLGAPEWTDQLAERLNIEFNPRPQGRPPREKCTDTGSLSIRRFSSISYCRWVSLVTTEYSVPPADPLLASLMINLSMISIMDMIAC
jgi:hypothetical protein